MYLQIMDINEESRKLAKKLANKRIKENIAKDKAQSQKQAIKEAYDNKEWYTIRSALGNQWAN